MPEEILHQRAKQGDPLVSEVDMLDGKGIEVQAGDKHTLFTDDLVGCQAVLLLGEHTDGKKTAILTHYPPLAKEQNAQHLRKLISQYPELKNKDVKLTSVLVVPEKEGSAKYTRIPKNPALVELIQSAIKDELGDNITEITLPYPQFQEPGKKRSKAFMIDFPAEAGEPVRYTACGTHAGQLT